MAGVPGEACSRPSGRSGEPFGAPGPGARQTARGVPRTSVRAAREGLPAIGRSACTSRGRRRPHLHSRFTPAAGGGDAGCARPGRVRRARPPGGIGRQRSHARRWGSMPRSRAFGAEKKGRRGGRLRRRRSPLASHVSGCCVRGLPAGRAGGGCEPVRLRPGGAEPGGTGCRCLRRRWLQLASGRSSCRCA